MLLASGKAGQAGLAAWPGRARRVKASEGGGLAEDDGGGGGGLEGPAPAGQAGLGAGSPCDLSHVELFTTYMFWCFC